MDIIVYATGYNVAFKFLGPSADVKVENNRVSLYKYVFPASTDSKNPLGKAYWCAL